ncbi:MAG: radical SAM protein [Dehalococcoidia bacterium]|nr:MAG: radical SAM protein [Dehalococcoidia bacterium]
MSKALRYEIGPIRPPNEAYSLLVRFTRNCPWNQCIFCHVYKGRRFEKRTLDEIIRDIDTMKTIYDDIMSLSWKQGLAGKITESLAESIFSDNTFNECYKSVALWLYFGGKNVFIQDANSPAMNHEDFIAALTYLKEKFPSIDRITSYARSRTIAKRISAENLKRMKDAGLTRLHIGLETGNNFLLKFMNKGVTREEHIECGKKVKASGIELSEYVVLGMGGKKWWKEHAQDTADVLNSINPDFIRFRTLKAMKDMPLYEKIENGDFVLSGDEEILREERFLIEHLEGITSHIKSDHILNLLEEVDGKLPEEKERILGVIDEFFALSDEQRLVFRFGRRAGIYRSLNDLGDELTYFKIKKQIREMEQKEPGSVEKTLSLLLENYI